MAGWGGGWMNRLNLSGASLVLSFAVVGLGACGDDGTDIQMKQFVEQRVIGIGDGAAAHHAAGVVNQHVDLLVCEIFDQSIHAVTMREI